MLASIHSVHFTLNVGEHSLMYVPVAQSDRWKTRQMQQPRRLSLFLQTTQNPGQSESPCGMAAH